MFGHANVKEDLALEPELKVWASQQPAPKTGTFETGTPDREANSWLAALTMIRYPGHGWIASIQPGFEFPSWLAPIVRVI